MKRLTARHPAASAFIVTLAALAATFVAIVFASASAHAAITTPTSSAGPAQHGVSLTSVTGLSVPEFAASAEICIEGAAARYVDDGISTPSASIGIPAPIGCIAYAGPFAAFRIIGSGATMDVSFYK
jgi:hypothetical protein